MLTIIDCVEGDFVVTANKNGINLVIGWVDTIKINENENLTSYIVSKIIHNNDEFPTPMTETEFDNSCRNDEDDIPF